MSQPFYTYSDISSLFNLVHYSYIIQIIRDVCISDGYFAGWECFAQLASNVNIRKGLVNDAVRCVRVYTELKTSVPECPTTDLRAVIVDNAQRDSMMEIAPKTLGGTGWRESEEYLAVLQQWDKSGFEPLGPCTIFALLGVQRKTILADDLDDCDAMMLLGSLVDYDLDRLEGYSPGFAHAMAVSMGHVADGGSRMQGMALASLLNFDVQQYNRMIQEDWVEAGLGSSIDIANIPAAEWIAMMVGDSGTLGVFGYESGAAYADSRATMFTGMVVAGSYDLLYDRAISSRVANSMYVSATGMAKHNMHAIFAVSAVDAVARRISSLGDTIPLLGDNALLVTAAWAPFNIRYHAWERFVKYSRQIASSAQPEAHRVAAMAKDALVFGTFDIADIVDSWRKANTEGAEKDLIPRETAAYTPSPTPVITGLHQPDLCASCIQPFQQALRAFEDDEIHAVAGIPANVISSPAVAIAAAIHRVAVFASGLGSCDICACRIGCWADLASAEVMIALMKNERTTSASEWLLQCYIVCCVPLSPVSTPAILTGFDVLCEITVQEGAMGSRDVKDT
ncbi:hypothetical protein DFH09DRAFT_923845 [Mycena vulgaris]|nr:hypothetical protein DFH09DRAFT_923845 [Mycena vulgaris]